LTDQFIKTNFMWIDTGFLAAAPPHLRDVLTVLQRYIQRPHVNEEIVAHVSTVKIAEELQITPDGVRKTLKQLRRLGWIETRHSHGRAKSIVVLGVYKNKCEQLTVDKWLIQILGVLEQKSQVKWSKIPLEILQFVLTRAVKEAWNFTALEAQIQDCVIQAEGPGVEISSS
jgi:DNA-binding MarR family transcriptional regulator